MHWCAGERCCPISGTFARRLVRRLDGVARGEESGVSNRGSGHGTLATDGDREATLERPVAGSGDPPLHRISVRAPRGRVAYGAPGSRRAPRGEEWWEAGEAL